MRRCSTAAPLLALAVALAGGCADAPEPPALLLLVTVDTLRADRLGAYGGDGGLTPNLDALARESVVFTRAYAPAPFTLPSISALLTGRYPEEIGVFVNESGLRNDVPTLATRLSEHGWHTGAVVGNFVLREESGLARGFAHFDDDFSQLETVRRWPERIAADTTDAALARLADCGPEAGRSCFLWVHYQDPHGPYTPPAGLRDRFLARERAAPGGTRELPVRPDHRGLGGIPAYQRVGDEREVAFYRAGYDGEVAYLDSQIVRLLDAVRAPGFAERTWLVFAADHGEALGEDDYWFAHGERLTDALVRVPLLTRFPGQEPGRRDDPVSLIDLAPSLLHRLAGIAPDAGERGRDLFAPGADRRASTAYLSTLGHIGPLRFGIVDRGYKFVVTERDGSWDGRLTRQDREEVDLTAAAPQLASPLRERLAAFRREMLDGLPEQRPPLSDEDRERLRALGYAEGP